MLGIRRSLLHGFTVSARPLRRTASVNPSSAQRFLPRIPNCPISGAVPPRQRLDDDEASINSRPRPTAIVTGAARGIGKAIALRLARDGYDITVNDVASQEEALSATVAEINSATCDSSKACGHVADVSSLEAVRGLIKFAVENNGPLTTMVANAGIAQVKPLLELTPADFQRMFEVNVAGVHYCYQAAAEQMISQGTPGKLIGAASIVAFKPFPLLGHYSASKWAVRGLTQVYAMELAKHKITANAYAPGIVDTNMWEQIDDGLGKMAGGGGKQKGDMMRKYSDDLIALGRTSVPEDVAKLVSFLAGEDADYLTGQTMVVDGGIIFT